MDTRHFQLIFKRGQSDTSPPTFSLLVVAEMSPAFIASARHYGRWNDIMYADPKLREARDLRARDAEARAKQRHNRRQPLTQIIDRPVVATARITLALVKLIWLGPPKLLWWIWCAIRTQRAQILRLRELQTGKVIAANTLNEIKDAEDAIREAAQEIEDYIVEAANYDGRAFEPERTKT